MDDQSKLRALVDVAERPEYDEVFEKLAHGQLSDAEVEALRTSSDSEVRRLHDLFRPLDAAARRRFDAAVAKLDPQSTPLGTRHDVARLDVTPLRPKKSVRRIFQVGLPLAAAAALLIIYISSIRPPERPGPAAPLKLYSHNRVIERSASGSTLLGSEGPKGDVVQLLAADCWRLQLGVSSDGLLPEAVQTLFVSETSVMPWDVSFVRQSNDRLAPSAGCAKLPALAPGGWTLFVFSGRELPQPASTPASVTTACSTSPAETGPWRCDRYPIRIVSSRSTSPSPEQP